MKSPFWGWGERAAVSGSHGESRTDVPIKRCGGGKHGKLWFARPVFDDRPTKFASQVFKADRQFGRQTADEPLLTQPVVETRVVWMNQHTAPADEARGHCEAGGLDVRRMVYVQQVGKVC
jgi:hypothetical protein